MKIKEKLMGAETLLSDMSYNTHYEFLEYASDKSEMDEVAKKAGLKLPAHDLAVFKGIYGFIDRQNKNGCTISKEEAEKALDSLAGKAVDFDHLRERVVGYWLDAKLEKDEIVAYGIFFKGNFAEDYELVRKLMAGNNLGISFEAWGNKEFANDGSYNFSDVEFAGGALLLKTTPAFDGAGVLEMSNQKKVLEFAKVMTGPNSFVLGTDTIDIEKQKELEKVRKIREESLNKNVGGNEMEQKIKELEKELAAVKVEAGVKDSELASVKEVLETAKATIETLKSESDEAKVKIEEIEKAKVAEVAEASKNATTVAERKAELGEEFSKDVDLLNDAAYENAKLKKQLAAKDVEIAKLKTGDGSTLEKASLEIGSGETKETKDKISVSRKRIQDEAFKE